MPLVAPFHSANPNALSGLLGLGSPQVYHNNALCTEGNNIEVKYWAPGTAGRPLCQRCAGLNMQGR